MEDWAQRIKTKLEEIGGNQADLAKACGIRPGSVSGWFGGGKATKMISGDNLVSVAEYLGTSAEYIITGREDGRSTRSHVVGMDAPTLAQALELLHLMADARPEDRQLQRPTWAMLQVAAKAIQRAEGDQRQAMGTILKELAKET